MPRALATLGEEDVDDPILVQIEDAIHELSMETEVLDQLEAERPHESEAGGEGELLGQGDVAVALGEDVHALLVPGARDFAVLPEVLDDDLLTAGVHDLGVMIHAVHARHGARSVASEFDSG